MNTSGKLETVLTKHGYKVTEGRRRVYAALMETHQPLSNPELVRLLSDVDKVSVYRTIGLFEKLGIVHRIWNGFKSSIELADEFSPHHHHFTCTSCGQVTSFKSERLEEALQGLDVSLDVSITQHVVELRGICKNCRNQGVSI